MSNIWCYLFNRTVAKSRIYNVGSTVKLSIEKRGMFSCVAYKNTYGCEKRTTSSGTTHRNEFGSVSHTKKSNLRMNKDKIFSSPFEDLILPRELVHEFVWKNLERWANKTAAVCSVTGRSYTYAQLRTLSGKFASALRKLNLEPENTIHIILPNIPEFAIIVLGASEAGIRVTMSNPISTSKEISRQMINSEAVAVITNPEQYAVVKESVAGNPNVKVPIILIDDNASDSLPEGSIRFSELVGDSVEMFTETRNRDSNNEDTMLLPYSSGTTGLPKGVELSHRNLITNCKQLQTRGINPAYETTETHQDVVPVILPMFHIYGMVVTVLNYLSLGAKLVFLPKFNPQGAVKCMREYKVTLLYLAPPLVHFLANSELVSHHDLASVRFVMSGAAPIGAESVQRLSTKAQRDIILAQGYGLTETSPVISLSDIGTDNLDAVGYLVPNTELRIVGADEINSGQNVGVNEVGELYIRGPQVMKGYYRNAEATANTMEGEWFKTGDLGCVDDTGHVFIKDRLKELIKVKGFQVPPAELEELLRSHKNVLDAAVIAQPHDMYGEIPRAFIVLKPGVPNDAEEIKNFVADRVPKYKQLGSVKFVDTIPKSAAGKILRRELKGL